MNRGGHEARLCTRARGLKCKERTLHRRRCALASIPAPRAPAHAPLAACPAARAPQAQGTTPATWARCWSWRPTWWRRSGPCPRRCCSCSVAPRSRCARCEGRPCGYVHGCAFHALNHATLPPATRLALPPTSSPSSNPTHTSERKRVDAPQQVGAPGRLLHKLGGPGPGRRAHRVPALGRLDHRSLRARRSAPAGRHLRSGRWAAGGVPWPAGGGPWVQVCIE